MQMLITEAQARELLANRSNGTVNSRGKREYNYTGKANKRSIYAAIRREHGIPASTKIKFYIENPDNELYRVIRDKRTGVPLDNGLAAPTPVVAVAATPAKVAKPAAVKKAPAKKVVATKAAAVKVKSVVAKKAVAKKAAAVKVAAAKPIAVVAKKVAPSKKTAVPVKAAKSTARVAAKPVAVKPAAKKATVKALAKKAAGPKTRK